VRRAQPTQGDLAGPRNIVDDVTAVLAHQGGWDEILLVVAPMVIVGGLLWIAKRRVDRAAAATQSSDALDASADRR
jgi:hypothetical protein